MQPTHPCPARLAASLSSLTCWWQKQASGLLLCWQLWLGAYFVGFFFCLFFLPGYVALWDSKTPHRHACEKVSYCLETSPSQLPPQDRSPSLTLLSLFLSFVFCPTSFWREWAAFWVPGVLRQCSEVVLWQFLSIQMIFWWICGGRKWSPLPIPLLSWDCPQAFTLNITLVLRVGKIQFWVVSRKSTVNNTEVVMQIKVSAFSI